MSKSLTVEPLTLELAKEITKEEPADVHVTNVTGGCVAFKFRVANTGLCHVKPPKGILGPGQQQKVVLKFSPGASADGKEGIHKIKVQALPVRGPMSEPEFKNVWITDKDKIEDSMITVTYTAPPVEEPAPREEPSPREESAPVEESVLLQTAVEPPQKPAEPAVPEEPPVESAAEEPAPELPAVEKPAEPEGKNDIATVAAPADTDAESLRADNEKLRSEIMTYQSKNAQLQSKVDELQKKVDAGSSVDRADRRSWIMLLSSIIILLSVIIYSFSRPSSSPQQKEI